MIDSSASPKRLAAPRHSILDLAPLELECMNALWPIGEGTVREIHRQLATFRPRAYTTILTIMDRLAHKGIVTRRKVGRAFRYQANVSVEEARYNAVDKIITGFFAGSADALAVHLAAQRQAKLPLTLNPDQSLSSGATIDASDVSVRECGTSGLDDNSP